jgi:hypothetical protein
MIRYYLKLLIIFLIQFIENVEHSDARFKKDDSDKILNSLKLKDYQILTDTGYKPLSHLHITKPYQTWQVKTQSGKSLTGADRHILFDENMNQIWISQLKVGSQVQTVDGIEKIDEINVFSPKVQMFDASVDDDNHRYWTNGFLSHNTVTASIYNAWYLTFNVDKNTLILANKGETTKEIIDKTKVVVENLPFFMKPGIQKYDVMNVRCDNGCRIVGQTTTKKSGLSFTIHNLYIDEFAHIDENILNPFWENVYPTLSASKISRITITSTPNGFNKFYYLYRDACNGDNEFKPERIDWWEHPDRDDAWYKQEVANLGSVEAFERQYGNEFISATNLLLDPGDLKKMRKNMKEYIHHDIEVFEDTYIPIEGYLNWDPDFDIEQISSPENFWLFDVDIAEGNGGDYSVINIFQIVPKNENEIELTEDPGAMYDFFKLKQVGKFRSNEHVIEDFAKVLYLLSTEAFYNENVKMVIEYNTYGEILIQYLKTVFPHKNDLDEEMILKFKHKYSDKVAKQGLKIKSDNKAVMCQNFAKLYKNNRFDITDNETINEASVFGVNNSGSYSAQMGNDDLIMTCITATEFFNTTAYADTIEELLDYVDPTLEQKMENILEQKSGEDGDMQYDIYDLV